MVVELTQGLRRRSMEGELAIGLRQEWIVESLTLLAFVGIWIALGLLAARFGIDSREGVREPAPRRFWDLPARDGPTAEWRRDTGGG